MCSKVLANSLIVPKGVKRVARRKSPTLTEVELELMNVLWEKGSATVGEVVEALQPERTLAYSSVLTIKRILEQEGYVEQQKESRAYVYRAIVDRQQAQRSVVSYLIKRFYNNSAELLVVNLVEHDGFDNNQLTRRKR